MKNFRQFISSLDDEFKKNLQMIIWSYFTALFCYPMIRSITTTQFIESYGATSTPKAWLASVIGLSFVIWACNKIQVRFGVQKLFFGLSLLSSVIFLGAFIGYQAGIKELSYLLYIWKEIYIVLLIHLVFAYANVYFNLEQMKRLIGLIGGLGSLGGVLGGLLTSYVVKTHGMSSLMYLSIILIFINGFMFLYSKRIEIVKKDDKNKISPLASIKEIKFYVFLVAGVVALSQFIINIADLQFNLLFAQAVEGSVEKTAYQGQVHTWINFVALLMQLIIIPFFFVRVSNRVVQIFIPIFYIILISVGMGIGGAYLLPVAISFILFKATDYSIFAMSKEILYHALKPAQKYGTKYVADMVVYRAAKALIAVILIYVQGMTELRMMSMTFLVIWLVFLYLLFKKQNQLIEE